ncbi:MAG: wax ester/triacylglycerol synthase family O-acyltransferase [Acidimicrobiia bacterium]|jgi:WS/DGAT/MGAT family acyltransferase|nr:wax ester/triacylglycerol synthase family O-acyltransferase [Acidimicrobiia bacterium]
MVYERLTALDSAFLHIEAAHQPMHVGGLCIVEGRSFRDAEGRFRLDDLRAVVDARLRLVPRFRKKLMTVTLDQGRPIWVDDEAFDLAYHVRHAALPTPGSETQLRSLFERVQSHLLDRRRPLWELWFVEGLEGDRVAIITKTHHAMVDGISNMDVATVLFDLGPEVVVPAATPWRPEPPPSAPQLLIDSVVERAVEPAELVRSVRAAFRVPRHAAERAREVGRAMANSRPLAPRMPWNGPITPHRRWEPVRVPIPLAKAIKDAASVDDRVGGRVSLNDIVLATVAGGLRTFLTDRRQSIAPELVLKAMVPVSTRAAADRAAAAAEGSAVVGNEVSMVATDLAVGIADPVERLEAIATAMRSLKESGTAVGADLLLRMTGYAPPTVLAIASRLAVRARAVNLVITNVPGPQFPLYCFGARMLEIFPFVPVADGHGLTVAVVSYDGQLGFGINADRELMPDLSVFCDGVRAAFDEYAELFGVHPAAIDDAPAGEAPASR